MKSKKHGFGSLDTFWRRPRSMYLAGGGWILFMCWFIWSLVSLNKLERPVLIHNQQVESHFRVLDQIPAARVENMQKTDTVEVKTSRELLSMHNNFYTSSYNENDTSTTIIFNVYQGNPKALAVQLTKALHQKHVLPPEVWVMCFNSSMENKYRRVIKDAKDKHPELAHRIKFTVSNFNYKFHGRFLLAYMATTKYVLVVDDDRAIDGNTVNDYVKYMKVQKGLWGNSGHRRGSTFEGYRSWPRNFTGEFMAELDYLCGMWFLEQSWLEYFMKERPPSWATSEDMHLSHVLRKYLNLNTYAGRVTLGKTLPHKPKKFQATKGSALHLREYIFDHELGRGNKIASVDAPIKTLVYAETADTIEDYLAKLDACPSTNESTSVNIRDPRREKPWCTGGKTAAVFRGAKEQDVVGLIAAAEKLCAKTQCEYFSLKPTIRHGIRYFNMREGFGQADTGVEIPFQTGASDVMLSLVGILNNIMPDKLFVPDVGLRSWPETDATKRNRLKIYHRTVLLAVDIHRSSKTNGKAIDGQAKDEWLITDDFPRMETMIWQKGSAEDPIKYTS